MEVAVDDIVMPGDKLKPIEKVGSKKKVILGPGLRTDGEDVYTTKAGILKKRLAIYYVDCHQKRYIPSQGENVVGVVTQKAGDLYKVDIGASEPAVLSYLAFEGSSKRNRPDVQVGDIVYAKLAVAGKYMESELVCVDSFGKKGKLGILSPEGMMFSCSLNLVRKVLKPDYPLLKLLSEELKYEVAVGMNGKIWIKSKNSVQDTIAIANAILASEYTIPSEYPSLRNSIMQALTVLR
ncbi:exosome complex component RRP40 [Trichogramma pretiosum]|uniref:exosome complex component RRP40 n=1 Tax=Trichogramma pretiosum TaxID=7493 RepID=UPI0006C94851|nr:exosome complex component RRP40 [Trichogramma pretiosum]